MEWMGAAGRGEAKDTEIGGADDENTEETE